MDIIILLILAASGLSAVSSHAGRQYHFVYDLKNMSEAQSYCREKYSDLATIDDMEDVETLRNMVNLRQMAVNATRAWIGLYDDLDSWRWSLSDTSFYKDGESEFRRWEYGELSNVNSNQHCTALFPNEYWHDYPCEESLEAVCMDVTGSTGIFVLINVAMTWTEAQSYCREHHTDLASVRNMTENQKVQELMPVNGVYWIGLFRDSWKWLDGSNSSFRYWKTGEPTGWSDSCGAADFSNSGKWLDENCGSKKTFICYSPAVKSRIASPGITDKGSRKADSEEWKTNEALCTYHAGDGEESMVTVQTSTCAFNVDLGRLSECSEYFRALSQSRMRETSESLIHLDHVSSSVFHNLLEFSFHRNFKVPQEELGPHIQVSSYLLAEAFLSKCLSVLADKLSPGNCLSYLSLAQDICCAELKMTVFTYLSRNLLEVPHLIKCLNDAEKEEVVHLRVQGDRRLCSLRKENLTSWNDPETERARHIFVLKGSEDSGDWCPFTELPFRADKWCFTTVVLYNYLYIIGGYRQRVKRGWEFKMASLRYNPFTHTWATTAPLIKHRRHFSAVACEGRIYAVGGWYLDSLVTPDSSTALYTAVERYDPWEDTWRFVSSLPLTDFQFTMSLSYDLPLATSLGHCLYVLGSIQRTGEKLLLQYNTRQDSWSELLPTLTRADADLPTLYFLGATDRLLVIGGNNSENVVTSFCVQSQRWGQVHRVEKVALAGQGTIVGDQVLMPSIEHNTVARMDLQTLSFTRLPPLPIPTRYEAVFYLHF